MKKPILLTAAIAAATLLASCGGDGTTCSSCPAGSEGANITPITFAQQCEAEGIDFTYEDPNAAYYIPEALPSNTDDIDLELGGSTDAAGNPADNESETSSSYYTIDYAMSRLTTYWTTYTWAEAAADDTATASTIAEAATLENAKYVTDLFPNDGKEYVIESQRGWPYAAVSYSTVDEDGTPRVSTAIPGARKGEDGIWRMTGYITMKDMVYNMVRTGEAMALLYEWHPEASACYGGRLALEVDFDATYASVPATEEGGSPTQVKLTKGMTKEELPANASYVVFSLKVTHLYSMGYANDWTK